VVRPRCLPHVIGFMVKKPERGLEVFFNLALTILGVLALGRDISIFFNFRDLAIRASNISCFLGFEKNNSAFFSFRMRAI
jgi:hypothetical protein